MRNGKRLNARWSWRYIKTTRACVQRRKPLLLHGRRDWLRTSDLLPPGPHSAREVPSNRQQFLHGDPDFQLLKLPFEARLEALQAAKTLELGIAAKIHNRERHDAILKDLWSRLPESLQGNESLRGRDAAKAVEQLLLKRDALRSRNGPARAVEELRLHLHNWLEVHVLRREAEALIQPANPR
jgi:hypothetical protein